MQRIVLMTSDQARHRWLGAELGRRCELVGIVCESKPPAAGAQAESGEVSAYFRERDAAEERWFGDAPKAPSDLGCPVHRVEWGGANTAETRAFVRRAAPDCVYLFGASIVREPLLADYAGRIVNMHLGLSPYYRGSATNFWPLVHGVPECVGVTVHHATLRVDGGDVLLQGRPEASADDDSHDLGCKAIRVGAALLAEVARGSLPLPKGVAQAAGGKLCRRADFNVESLRQLRRNLAEGMMPRYVADKAGRDGRYPIVTTLFS